MKNTLLQSFYLIVNKLELSSRCESQQIQFCSVWKGWHTDVLYFPRNISKHCFPVLTVSRACVWSKPPVSARKLQPCESVLFWPYPSNGAVSAYFFLHPVDQNAPSFCSTWVAVCVSHICFALWRILQPWLCYSDGAGLVGGGGGGELG